MAKGTHITRLQPQILSAIFVCIVISVTTTHCLDLKARYLDRRVLNHTFSQSSEAQAGVVSSKSKPITITNGKPVPAYASDTSINGTSASHIRSGDSSMNTSSDNRTSSHLDLSSSSDFCDKSDNKVICSAGSRMYKLLSYDVEPSLILPECYAACNESYSRKTDENICKSGCLSQVQVVKQRQSELAAYAVHGPSAILQEARRQQMLSHYMFEMIAGFDLFNHWYDMPSEEKERGDYSTLVVVEQSENQLRISRYRVFELHAATAAATASAANAGPLNPYAESQEKDFEPKYARTIYSKWVLCLLLFSSGLFLVWLTCSTVTTAPKHHVTNQLDADQEMPDEKLSLKMMLAYHPAQAPVAVHTSNKSDDVKLLLA